MPKEIAKRKKEKNKVEVGEKNGENERQNQSKRQCFIC